MDQSMVFKHPDDYHLYISGPMSGYEDFNYPRFNEITEALSKLAPILIGGKQRRVVPVNPATLDEMIEKKLSWSQALCRDVNILTYCDGIALFDDWPNSRGAIVEAFNSEIIGKDVWYVINPAEEADIEPAYFSLEEKSKFRKFLLKRIGEIVI